jgi:DNA-3-methyladenine glycosylase II
MGNTITFSLNSPEIQYLIQRDGKLGAIIQRIGPMTYTTYTDGYSFLIHEIIEQMLSVKAGQKIFSRLVDLCEGKLTPDRVSSLSFEEIKSIGTATSKVRFIQEITNEVLSGNLNFDELNSLSDEDAYKKLMSIRGIGNWTASMYLLFVKNSQDVLPYDDAAFLQTFKWLYKKQKVNKNIVQNKCHKWSPYSSLGARYFYKALDTGLTKIKVEDLLEV